MIIKVNRNASEPGLSCWFSFFEIGSTNFLFYSSLVGDLSVHLLAQP